MRRSTGHEVLIIVPALLAGILFVGLFMWMVW